MKIYRLVLSENTIPCYVLPLKFIDQGKGQLGFLMYSLNRKGVTKNFILEGNHGILQLPEVDKSQKDVDVSTINTAEEFITHFLNNYDQADLNTNMRDTCVDLDFELTDEDKRVIIDKLGIDQEGKFKNTIFLT